MRAARALLLAAAAVLFFTGLGRATLFDQDEAKYAQVAREILQTGDPITLHLNGRPWFVHPPLYLWLQAVAGRLFGFTEFTARLWSAVAGVAGVYAASRLGQQLFTPRTGLLAAAVLPATFQYFAQSRLAVFDGLLVTCMLLAFSAFVQALDHGDRRQAYWAAAWAGLGTLTKGPIALLLPGLVAAAFLLLRRRQRAWRAPVLGPAAVYAALALPWYLVEWVRHGLPFIRTVIGYYTVQRFVGVVEGQSGPWWYYGPVLGIGAFPWTAFLVAMVPYHLRRRRADGSLLVLLWTGLTLAFYTAAGTKLPNYVLPVYPMAAVGIAAMWDASLGGDRQARAAVGAAFAGTVLALVAFAGEVAAFARIMYPGTLAALQQHLVTVAAVLGGWLLAASACYAARRPVASFALLVGTMWVLGGALVFRTLPMVDARRPIKPVAAAVRARLDAGELPLVGYRISDHQTLLFYTAHRVFWVDDFPTLLAMVCTLPRMVVVMRPADLRGVRQLVPAYAAPAITPLITTGELAAVEVGRAPACRVPPIGR